LSKKTSKIPKKKKKGSHACSKGKKSGGGGRGEGKTVRERFIERG